MAFSSFNFMGLRVWNADLFYYKWSKSIGIGINSSFSLDIGCCAGTSKIPHPRPKFPRTIMHIIIIIINLL